LGRDSLAGNDRDFGGSIMKGVFVVCVAAAFVAASAVPAAADVKIEGASFAAMAYIRDDGRVEDTSFRTLGYVRPEGRVEDARFRALGYVRGDGRVEDARFRTVGYVRDDGTIEDASFRTVGYVREGVIQDASFGAVGFYKGKLDGDVDAAVGAYLFFFSAVLFVQPFWDTVYEP
jgi:hypothetical protein